MHIRNQLRPTGAPLLRRAVLMLLFAAASAAAWAAPLAAGQPLPALRQLPFAIGLGRDAALAADLPRQKGQVTVIALQDGVVTAWQFVATPDALRQALGLR